MSDKEPGSPKASKDARKRRGGFKDGEIIDDRYEVLSGIGRGGMGMVYRVRDIENGQTLALKTLLPQYASHKYAVKRFLREIDAVRQLDHPCIVKIYTAREVNGLLYYTMEYVEGKSLFRWIKQRGQMGLGSTVRVLSLLCHALEHAHQYTIHRDLSPDNVMIMPNGSIKLLDFGLAKLTTVDSQFTMIGVNLGKREYSAPEQRANARDVDLRADIYSLGVIFHEMLTGKRPDESVALTELRPDLPKDCDAFARKAMADDPEDRFADAREMRHALDRLYKKFSEKRPAATTPAPEATVPAPSRMGPIKWLVKAWRALVLRLKNNKEKNRTQG